MMQDMTIYQRLMVAFWLLGGAYWAVAAFAAKRNIGGRARRHAMALRLGVLLLALLLLSTPGLRHALRAAQTRLAAGALTGLIGVVLCGLGIGLAIVARACLGRNWGMPMSRKQDPELVTSGPYAFVRHPIYGGMLLAMLGSAIGLSVFWLLPLLLFGPYFIYSAAREEQLMLRQFPGLYPSYRARTGMLLPCVFR